MDVKLSFEEAAGRNRCAVEVAVGDLVMQCAFSSSRIVTIPQGFSYFGGKLERTETAPVSSLPICQNHEARLKNAFAKMIGQKSE